MRRLLHLTFLCIILSSYSYGQAKYWVAPGTSGNWNVAANWSTTPGGAGGAGAPTPTQDAIFDGSSDANCVLNISSIIVRDFSIGAGYTGTISPAINNNILIANRDLLINGGNLNAPGTVVVSRNLAQTGGTFNTGAVSTSIVNTTTLTGGTINILGAMQFDDNLSVNIPGVTFNAGTSIVTFNGSVNSTVNVNGGAPGIISFYDVVLDKTNPASDNMNIAAGDQIIVQNDLSLRNGTLGTGTGILQVQGDMEIQTGFLGALTDLIFSGTSSAIVTMDAPFTVGGAGLITINKADPAATVSFVTNLVSNAINFGTIFGGSFNINSGTAVFPDGDDVTINYGTFNLGANGTFSASSGTTNIQGNINIDGAFIANGGTVQFLAGAARTISVLGGATPGTVTFNNIILNNSSATGNFNIEAGDQITATGNVTIIDGRFNGGTLQVNGNLTTQASSDATTTATALIFGGATSGTVTLDAGAVGHWNGPITINKTGGSTVTLASPFVIDQNNQVLTMTSGNFVTTTTNVLSLVGNNISLVGGSAASFVDGPLQTQRTSAFTYPVGDAGIYAPVHLSDGAFGDAFEVARSYQVFYVRQPTLPDFPNTNNPPSEGGVPYTISQCEYWYVDYVGAPVDFPPSDDQPIIWLSYEDQRSCGLKDPTTVGIMAWLSFTPLGAYWTPLLNSNDGLTVVDGVSYISASIRAFSVGNFNPVFTFGSLDPILNPLPVNWLSFTGRYVNAGVDLNWSTAMELNNETYTIERSADGHTFSAIGTVAGRGNTSQTSYYNFTDAQPLSGDGFYRIRQTDRDGKFSYSKVIRVSSSESAFKGLRLFPNPITASMPLTMENANWRNKKVNVIVYNAVGAVVSQQQINFGSDSRAKLNLSGLQKGSYFISSYLNGEKQTLPFFVQ
ncbi:T9SS type A sorting domain-containing protein [Flavihumibacter stibioxidans]|nr:T9SS type A sorting domain-containing protein [Flavihumibacter stibioxidans]